MCKFPSGSLCEVCIDRDVKNCKFTRTRYTGHLLTWKVLWIRIVSGSKHDESVRLTETTTYWALETVTIHWKTPLKLTCKQSHPPATTSHIELWTESAWNFEKSYVTVAWQMPRLRVWLNYNLRWRSDKQLTEQVFGNGTLKITVIICIVDTLAEHESPSFAYIDAWDKTVNDSSRLNNYCGEKRISSQGRPSAVQSHLHAIGHVAILTLVPTELPAPIVRELPSL